MQQLWKPGLALIVLAGALFAAMHFSGGGTYLGTWKVTLLQPGVEKTLCLLKLSGNELQPTAEVIDSPGFATAEAEDVRVDEGTLRFRLKTERGTFAISVRAPDGEARPHRLLGNFRDQAAYEMLRLERTDLQAIDPKAAIERSPGHSLLAKAADTPGAKEKEQAVRLVLDKYGNEPIAQTVLGVLLQLQVEAGASTEEMKETVDRYMAAAAVYGRGIELQAAARLALGFARLPAGRGNVLAETCARLAETLLSKEDPPLLVVNILKSVATVLRSAGKTEEARAIDARVAQINARMDEAYARNAVPFSPAPPAGRRDGSDRVVLTELFTGARCPPCAGADIAFDAALQVYKPSEVVFLQYHEHIPQSDPLTSLASEERLHYYDKEVRGTPSFVLDGKLLDEPVGGTAQRGEESYSILRTALEKAVQAPAEAHLKLTAQRQGDEIGLTAEVSDLQRPGDKTRLRFVLAEEVVHYAAANGQRLHHHVVRDFPGGTSGVPLAGKSAKHVVKEDLNRLRKQLQGYLQVVGDRQPFPDDDRPLELRQLKAIAFIQDDATKQVLQAAQADIPELK